MNIARATIALLSQAWMSFPEETGCSRADSESSNRMKSHRRKGSTVTAPNQRRHESPHSAEASSGRRPFQCRPCISGTRRGLMRERTERPGIDSA